MKNTVILIVLAFFQTSVYAQTYNKKYSESIEDANEYLAVREFADALPVLQKLELDGYANANIYYKLGQCYLNSAFDKTKAIFYLEKAAQNTTANYNINNTLEVKAPFKAVLYLGDAYRAHNRLKEAEKTYKEYKTLVNSDNQEQALAEKRILECQLARLFLKRPARIQFEKLNPIINSGLGNFNVCLSGDGKSMVFNRKMKFYDAIFYCTRTNGDWSEPKEITVNLGSDGEYHPTGLSPDGKRMLLTSYNQLTGFDIYESIFSDGKWRKIKLLSNSVNSPFYDIDAVYGPDGKEIYFSSNRTSGFGGFDLYKASVDDAGNIGQAENLGNAINSEWDEKSPTFMDSGKVLLFSSQRNPCMGGFDYFYARLGSDGKWGLVYNAGYPLSTVDDDEGLSTSSQGNEGLLTRHDPGSSAEQDIFDVRLDVLSKFRQVPLKGEVRLANGTATSFKGLTLYFVDETINDTIGMVESPEGGKYKIDLYPGNFKLAMVKDSAGTVSQEFTIPSDDSKPDFELVSEFQPGTSKPATITKLTKVDTIVVADILFDFDSYRVSAKEKENLVRLLEKIKKHSITGIELLGYTDCIGNKAYNQILSEKRAANVKEFLITKGLSKDILSAKGMGDTVNPAKNKNADGSDCPEGRAYNRRVEIRITASGRNLLIINKDLVPANLKP
jgi:outer membrane protein OmpA-like peptidoglycan-associated protein